MTQSTGADSALTYEFTSSLDELTGVRNFCRDIVNEFWRPEDVEEALCSFQLAVIESVTNVIRHAYDLIEDQPIRCVASCDNGVVTFEVLHNGKSYTPPDEIDPILEPLEGGMGMYLIEQCVNQVSFLQVPDGRQCIRLSVNLPE